MTDSSLYDSEHRSASNEPAQVHGEPVIEYTAFTEEHVPEGAD